LTLRHSRSVVIAVLAFLVAAWQAYIANDTEKRTLRAYVGIVDHHIENVALDGAPHVQVMIKNFGSTPASNVTYWIASKFDRYPKPIDLPVQPFKPDKVVLFPTDGFTATFDIGALNKVDMAGLNEGSRRLYVYGEIDYRDAFEARWCTRFRLIYGSQQMLKIGRMALAENGKEIEEHCQN
jgi:type II secretory pathway pseudopilin PulG